LQSPADGTLATAPLDERTAFVRAHTALVAVPFVPPLRLFTATDLTPLWRATQAWLGRVGLDVPFWCVPWAGGQALARWVLDHPEVVRGRRVVDFGAGSGLVGIACALAGAASVRVIDVDPLAEAACLLNAEANGVSLEVVCADVVGSAVDADVLFAGDVWYERAAAARFAPWLRGVARSGVRVVTGDPCRTYVPDDLVELARFDVPTTLDLESATTRLTRVLEVPV
jgi:predicted nicotinamide N-methyase